ncbi:hypothetical protein FHL15_008750 [Xylaria flabelliformis]|uniref:Uncharacterized protein n=1 Tax=Xylaria flabelliformis TaxID=2512241 RepID=A0A553HR00_9PEZI|nr:hypothetical protein FHL15_008750 [Xylaria flabelliformis]
MVFVIPPNPKVPRLRAYLLPSFPLSELPAFKQAFEFGTCAPFNPMLELVIAHAPADWAGQSFEYMRRKEDEAGREAPFVVVDERGAGGRDGAVWYVEHFATEDEVEDGEAASTSVVWRIPVKTDCLALMWVNYDIANMSLQEDLCNLGVELPVDANYEVLEVDNCGGLDMESERKTKRAVVVAEPGEFVERTDEAPTNTHRPVPPRRVGRLKDARSMAWDLKVSANVCYAGLAETVGLVNEWSTLTNLRSWKKPDGTKRQFPEGSIELWLKYDPDFDWPEYKWPEGSL